MHYENIKSNETMHLDEFDFILPKTLIAQKPINPRENAKLLHIDSNKQMHDCTFSGYQGLGLLNLLKPGDLLIFNNTKVIPAKLIGYKYNALGNKKEISCNLISLQKKSFEFVTWKTLVKGKVQVNDEIIFSEDLFAFVECKIDEFVILKFFGNFTKEIEKIGHMPLPPYIKRNAKAINDSTQTKSKNESDNISYYHISSSDYINYQTIYAKEPGAVAAPTAGLHFSDDLISEIQKAKIEMHNLTLHVGGGTFLPIRSNDIVAHKMHEEIYTIPSKVANAINKAKSEGRRIVAVGTTTLRAIESAANLYNEYHQNSLSSYNKLMSVEQQSTNIFIYPPYSFKIVDALITNFHLPKSTLFLLVCAFAGIKTIKEAYQYAINNNYRFFSYGDGCFIERSEDKDSIS